MAVERIKLAVQPQRQSSGALTVVNDFPALEPGGSVENRRAMCCDRDGDAWLQSCGTDCFVAGNRARLGETIDAIDSARVNTRILYITAHPDDEVERC